MINIFSFNIVWVFIIAILVFLYSAARLFFRFEASTKTISTSGIILCASAVFPIIAAIFS